MKYPTFHTVLRVAVASSFVAMACAQTSSVSILGLSPSTVTPNGTLTIQMQITNTGSNTWTPLSTITCPQFYSFSDYELYCRPFPTQSGTYGIRLEVHPLDEPDWVNTYYITDLAFPHAIAPGETIVLTQAFLATLPPGRYRLALITHIAWWYAFTSRILHSPADSLALGATADFVVASDATPPSISLTGLLAGTCSIWPPNGKLVSVGTVTATDAQSGVTSLQVTATSNDPTMQPSADVIVEGEPTGPLSIQLRARRAGFGGDRIYNLLIRATDAVGNQASLNRQCAVPHDQGK